MPLNYAVFGVARFGNSRFGHVPAALLPARQTHVRILINGVEARTRVRVGSLSIHDVLNDAPNTARLTVEGTAPLVGQSLRVTVGLDPPTLLFNGTLETVDRTYDGLPSQVCYPCSATDDLARLNRRLPFGTWTNVSATTIAQALLAAYAPGFTGTHIEAGLPLVSVNFDGSEGFSGCLRQLAKLIGGYFYVEDLDLHLFTAEVTESPDDLDTTPGRFLDAPHITAMVDLSQVRTRVYGKGHGEATLAAVAAGASTIPLANAPAWFAAGGGSVITDTQVLTYTGLGHGATPTPAPWQVQLGPAVVMNWQGVIWVETLGLFLAGGGSAAGSDIMTSPDGVTWTLRTTPSIGYSRPAWSPTLGRLVAVGTNSVITSPDGITWTTRTAAAANAWVNVCWAAGLNLFVAVAQDGASRVMTSPDGITWTARTAAAALLWQAITWSPERALLVAVANVGTTSIMTSPDGITWTARTGGPGWDIAWSPALGLFVITNTSVATSPDGITWTTRTVPAANLWFGVTWAAEPGLFVAVSFNGAVDTIRRVMTSADGIHWIPFEAPPTGAWTGVAYAPSRGLFVAVSSSAGTIQVMSTTVPVFDTITGIPPSGPGSIGVPLVAGAPVHLWVQRDDLAAQAAMAAIDGGDGIYEHLISDERRGEASLIDLCDADLAMFATPITTVTYASRDLRTKSGKTLVVNLPSPPISETLTIQDVTIDQIDRSPGTMPRFTVTASTVRFSLEDLLRRMAGTVEG